jgi:predicted acyltransferase
LVAVTAEGLPGALIAVFPLKFLDGRDLWVVSKRLWVAAFLIVSTAFALLVLPTAIAGTDVGDYGTWLLVFAVFGLVSLAVWIVFVRADARAVKAESEKVDA